MVAKRVCFVIRCSHLLSGSDTPRPPSMQRLRIAGVMFVVTSNLRLFHTVLISLSYLRISDQTGRTDIPLTERGQEQIKSVAPSFVGEGSTSNWIVRCPSTFSNPSLP
jgi:hypothetical protein